MKMRQQKCQSDISVGMKQIAYAFTIGIAAMVEVMKGRPNKLVKPAKVPSWTKNMILDVYFKALEVWMEMNNDVSEAIKFQDVIESLKQIRRQKDWQSMQESM